jgi:uncharacterized protein with PIN domain
MNDSVAGGPEETKEGSVHQRNAAEKIFYDDKARKLRQDELILYMGSPLYKLICYKMPVQARTLLDQMNIFDQIIKDDSVLI